MTYKTSVPVKMPCNKCRGLGFVCLDADKLHPLSNVAWLVQRQHAGGRMTYEGNCAACDGRGYIYGVPMGQLYADAS